MFKAIRAELKKAEKNHYFYVLFNNQDLPQKLISLGHKYLYTQNYLGNQLRYNLDEISQITLIRTLEPVRLSKLVVNQ